MSMMRKTCIIALICILAFTMIAAGTGEGANNISSEVNQSTDARVEALLKEMTIDEKIGQMVQADKYAATPEEVKNYFIGSILTSGDPDRKTNLQSEWLKLNMSYQEAAKETRLGIPLLIGVDAVHGHNSVYGATVFPHNIGLGAAGDAALMAEIADVTAKEMQATGFNWNFSPCVAVARDVRWGRTYESFSENTGLVSTLLAPYINTLQSKGIAATAKHYTADGGTAWGTGSNGYYIDQGNAVITEAQLRKIHLPAYKKAVDEGVKTIMVSYSSWNGVKLHENSYLINDVLKKELGFKGFVVSDYEAVHQLSGGIFNNQIVASVNSGVDMLMNGRDWKETLEILKSAVLSGDIKQERANDAVRRILKVKLEMGLLENGSKPNEAQTVKLRSDNYIKIAEKAVRESLVLLKNSNKVLPLKKSAKLLVIGPAASDIGIQCGGWTLSHSGGTDKEIGKKWTPGTTILEGFQRIARGNGGIITTNIKDTKNAAAVVVVIGEKPYKEGDGDDGQLGIYNGLASEANKKAISDAKATRLPIVVVIVSGRPRTITQEINSWNAVVEAWLPGSEGAAVADVLYGNYDFTGKLPVTWPKSVQYLPLDLEKPKPAQILFPYGFGLKMNK